MRKRSAVWIPLLLAGCAASNPSTPSLPLPNPEQAVVQPAGVTTQPLSRQAAQASEKLSGKRFSGLLNFEDERDPLFASAWPSAARLDAAAARTGRGSLLLPPGTQRLRLKLSSMLAGRDFPGEWTLLGMYVRADEPVHVVVSCADAGGSPLASRGLTLPPGRWTPAMLDLSALPNDQPREMFLELRFDTPTSGVFRVDDVLLIDNRETLVDAGPQGWTVARSGLRITCAREPLFTLSLTSAGGAPNGWAVEEANELRARFASAGETKALTVYADGRSVWDGVYKPQSAEVRDDAAFAAAHASPAEVALPETMGRVNRDTAGDANNDGYNERLAAYQVQARGGRLEMTMTPRGSAVPRPVLQIAGLPNGKALVTIEGRLVERSTRLADGQLLVELPARITRPTLVTVRIQ